MAESNVSPGAAREPRHGVRIASIWFVLSVIADLLIWFVWGPHFPPGNMTSSAASQQLDFKVLAVVAAPVMMLIYVFFLYALVVWRQRDGDEEDGPGELPGAARAQKVWVSVTLMLVLGLFGFGTYQLVVPAGAGAGEGANPVWKPGGGKPLQIQVIGQQWLFTYRYPSYGGFETRQLVLPDNQPVQFDVTSLDVIHSFWAIQLGVKADAVPSVNNVAYTIPRRTGTFTVRCAELCGIWHGAMYNYGRIVPVAAFQSWAQRTEAQSAALTKILPPFSLSYSPNEISDLAKVYTDGGLTGAGGQYYGSSFPAQP
ncbi:cytochrome c oxidase subunit II [Conexibacter sp. DBS9H8]|uniref:cytochrome c oxidase subunit II n=1 Tax=Conexibacter sp. DBS9H8 TaxID=2937801 RepID=UPI00200E8D22|nr:cytochrome c oxidase subunit II [Conexibacter sp. DBS9H8]